MKKYFALAMVAAFVLTSCDKDNKDATTPEKVIPTEIEYGGVTYKVKEMKDGNVWMTENLRFVPAGKTISGNPAEDNGIWYPTISKAQNKPDSLGVETKGLLYDFATAFGAAKIDSTNFDKFEGVQGICPEGWHIPTAAEMFALVGNMNAVIADTLAPYYAGGNNSLKAINDDGFNFIPYCYRNKLKSTATGTYTTAEYESKPSFSAIILSTPVKQKPEGAKNNYSGPFEEWETLPYAGFTADGTNVQYYICQTTCNATNNKFAIAFGNYLSGYFVRCVMNK